ncbi:MAG TPA: error-prone DNA polymerase [Spongiibacteraceae bacterium]|nr:error-prone DNA polymerase [Spongiibacteraceae bacterium]
MACSHDLPGMTQYAELHCLSNFSFLRGASHPWELVEQAAELGYSAVAITDECSFAGIVKAHVAALEFGIQLLIGSELQLEENLTIIAIAPNKTAYSELSALITLARRRSDKGSYRLGLRDLEFNLRHNLIIWQPALNASDRASDKAADNTHYAAELKRIFDNRLWLGFSNLLCGDEPERLEECYRLSTNEKIPLLACGNVRMHRRERHALQDALTAIRHNTSVDKLGMLRHGNSERYLRPLPKLAELYPAALLQETMVFARRCTFSLKELRYEYPPEVVPDGMTPGSYLRYLVDVGVRERWPDGIPAADAQQIDVELQLINELEYEYYFLTVHDIVRFARDHDILCQGRGSAANSVVCYCLGITEVSPANGALLFERFISKERNEPPDIDVDFEHERREEVIQYIYKKYTRERAALAATVICYRPRSAVRDIGKALGIDPLFIEQLRKSMAWWDRRDELQEQFRKQGLAENSRLADLFFSLVQQIRGFPRHLSQHVGGFIITKSPISTLVPVENAAMPERTIIQWDKEDIEALGLLKVDVLALGMLTAIRKCLALVTQHYGATLTMATIPPADESTYDMLCRADSVGVFQVESRAQMAMLPRLQPRKFYDLVIQVAIVRPGPIQGDMVHPYLRRRQGLEPVTYHNAAIEAVLKRTLGIPIFQEQAIKLAMVAAGFSAGKADQLRRAMASWGKNGNFDHFETELIDGMLERGHSLDFAQRLFKQMQGFGAYGFPESHAASFALLVYVSAWLKCHYPAAFYCALLNSLPMGFYSASQLVQDARRHAIEVRAIDVRHSDIHHTLENTTIDRPPALRLGLCLIENLGAATAARINAARAQQPFADIADLQRRAQLSTAQLTTLIAGGAVESLSGHRHRAHWQALALPAAIPLSAATQCDYDDQVQLAAPSEIENIVADHNSIGLTLRRHPLALLREHFALFRRCKKQTELATLNQGRFVRVAGLVTGRQRPGTQSGVIFVTLEDETGNINVVVWKDVQLRYREALLKAKILLIKGVLETDGAVVHVLAGELIDCTHYLQTMQVHSRDFH